MNGLLNLTPIEGGNGSAGTSSPPATSSPSPVDSGGGSPPSSTPRDFSLGSPASTPPTQGVPDGQMGGGQPQTLPFSQGQPGQQQGQPGQQQGQPGQQSAFTSIREAMIQRGLSGNWDNDATAFDDLIALAQQGQQNNYYAQLGQVVAPHWDQIQGQIGQGRQSPQNQQPAGPGPYKIQGFDRRILNYLQADDSGRLVPRPGAVIDPNLVIRANEWMSVVGEWQDQWATDPRGAFRDMFADQVREIVQQHYQQTSAQARDQGFARNVLEKHGDWIFARDNQGRRLQDLRTGRPALTPQGTQLLRYIEQAASMGVSSDEARFQVAMSQLQRDVAMQRLQALQPQQQGQPGQQQGQPQMQPQGFAAPAQTGFSQPAAQRPGVNGQPNWTQSQTSMVPQGQQVPPSQEGLSIEEMMRAEFRNAGITDQHIRESTGLF